MMKTEAHLTKWLRKFPYYWPPKNSVNLKSKTARGPFTCLAVSFIWPLTLSTFHATINPVDTVYAVWWKHA